MALFRNLFGGRDARSCFEKGSRLLTEGRYAEARGWFDDALERAGDDPALREEIRSRQGEAAEGLALLNLAEAERFLAEGEDVKARDHLELARSFATAPETVSRTEQLLRRPEAAVTAPAPAEQPGHGSACGSCASTSCAPAEPHPVASDGHLSPEERFELMTAALPEDLPRRYRDIGGRFAEAYLLAHDGDDTSAVAILETITDPAVQDIILYERALASHRGGDLRRCEGLLRQAFRANDRNPLCFLALVDLCAGTGRTGEALDLLGAMIDRELLPEQALMMRGDLQEQLGYDEEAVASFALLLSSPHKKEAASRIIPILEKLGRSDEARQLFTRYVKGCC